jgi:porphobilinogen synthase
MPYTAAMATPDPPPSGFPQRRPRRLRRSAAVRDAVADVAITTDRLICPVFIGEFDAPRPVASMPGVLQWPVEAAVAWMGKLASGAGSGGGVRQFLLFGVTPHDRKDAAGSHAADPRSPVNRALRLARRQPWARGVVLYADLCLCEYTDHGHCGVIRGDAVDNDATLALLGQTAVAQAEAGADVVAPSGMMDGQVGAIRRALDDAGHTGVSILSYSVKYASSLYGPFRDAGEGHIAAGVAGGDRRGYQMDPRRSREWRSELAMDLAEGADMVMVKPAVAYLDVVRQVRDHCDVPVVAYHVSGEYAMLHAAADRGWLDLRAAAMEHTLAIRRAGADLVVTYFAPQLVRWLGDDATGRGAS